MVTLLDPRGGKTWRFLLPLAFFFFLLSGCLASRPVQAQCCAEAAAAQKADTSMSLAQWGKEFMKWAKQFELLKTIIDIVTSINDFAKKILKTLNDKLGVLIAETHYENLVKAEMDVKMHEDKKITVAATAINSQVAKKVMEDYRRPDVKATCLRIASEQGRSANYFFSNTVENAVLKMLETRFLGPDADGSGPQAAAAMFGLLCPPTQYAALSGFPKPLPRDMNPPSGCSDAKFEGLLSARIVSGAYALQLPEFQDVGKYKIPNPKTDEEKYWVIANDWLFLAAGGRSTPPSGDAMLSPQGVHNTASWAVWASRESAQLQPCAKLIGYLTRTNCKNGGEYEKYKAKCVRDQWLCDAAKKAKLPDGKTDIDVDNMPGFDCKERAQLSEYQADYLRAIMCMSPNGMIGLVGEGGADPAQLQQIAASCAGAWEGFRMHMTEMQNACSEGLDALSRMRMPEMRQSPTIQN